MKFLYGDFEFSGVEKKRLDLICGSVEVDGVMHSWDLTQLGGRKDMFQFLIRHKDRVFVAYGLDSEVRAIESLISGCRNPFKQGLCLYREHLLLANRCKKITHGSVIAGSKLYHNKFDPKNNSERNEYVNLLNALFKFLGDYNETHILYKDRIRNMCIRNEPAEITQNMKTIIEYCEMDVARLRDLAVAMSDVLLKRQNYFDIDEALERGKYAMIIAHKVKHGYYLKMDELSNLIQNKPRVFKEIADHITNTWPQIPTFKWDKRSGRFVFKKGVVSDYIKTQAPSHIRKMFPKTQKTKEFSLSLDVFQKLYPNRHSLNPNDYLQQVYRYLYTRNALSGMTLKKETDPKKRKKMGNFIDTSEGVVRPHFNDFGSQTGRNQPRANGYILLKPAWTRGLLIPPLNHCLIISDWGKQEVLITAVNAKDDALLAAYASGDPYVAFGLKEKFLKEEWRGTPQWDVSRDMCKRAILSTIYQITASGLAVLLSADLNRNVTQLEAQRLINAFGRSFPKTIKYFKEVVRQYRRDKRLRLIDGWTMWGDNYNERSIANMPVQGTGAVAMRKTDIILYEKGIWCPLSLHDAFFVYAPLEYCGGHAPYQYPYHIVAEMVRAMRSGFRAALNYAPGSELITQDFKIIYPGPLEIPEEPQISVDGNIFDIEYSKKYIDKRALDDLKSLGKYFHMTISS